MKNTWVVKQRDIFDCGVCSLLSIIKFYNGYIPLEKLRLETNTTKNGTNFYYLLKAAKSYGFDGMGLKTTEKDLLMGKYKLPVIAHLNLENKLTHFVVIYEINKKYVELMDPSRGKVKMKLKDFTSKWTKNILVLYPYQKIIKLEKNLTIIDFFLKIIPIEKTLVCKIIIASIIITILSILNSFYFKFMMNNLSVNTKDIMILIFSSFLIINIFNIIFKYIKDDLEIHLNKNIDIRLIYPFLKHIFFLPLNIVKSRSTGEITSRISDLNNIKNLFSKIFITLSLDLLLTIISIFVLWKINYKLFILLCLIIVVYLIVGIILSSRLYKKIITNIDYETNFNSSLIENIEGLESIKNTNTIDYTLKNIENKFNNYIYDSFKFNKFLNLFNLLKNTISEIGLFLINSYAFYLILNQQLDILNLIVFNSLYIYLFEPIKNIVDIIPNINHLKVILFKVSDFYSIDEEKITKTDEKFYDGDILVKNVSFSYNDLDYIINNLNLKIKKQDKIFLQGKSGSGKSTFCKLLFRLNNPAKGIIKINDLDITNYNLNTIRENITYYSQKEKLFTDTLENNILLGRKINNKKITEILKICRVDEIIETKKLNKDSWIFEDGYNLSGGQKQRIALARTLIKDSKIIILDEPLSEVESELEKKIIKDLLNYFNSKTIIYVSHRNYSKLFNRTINFGDFNE